MFYSNLSHAPGVAHSLDVIPHVRCGFTPKKRQLYNRTTKGTTTSKKLKNYKAMAGKMLSKSNYAQMLTLLWKSSQAFHTALQEFVRKQVYKEARQFRTKPCKLRQNLSVSSIMDFDWTTTLQEIKAGMPFIHRIFCGMLETRKLSNGKITRVPPTEQRLGASIAVMLANRQPRTYKLLQSWVGVELWRSGCRQKGFSCLRELGMSQSAKATRACVDRVGSEFDAEPCNWKRDIEVGHQSSTEDVGVQPLRFTSDEDEDDVNVARREPLTLDVSQ